MKISANTKKLMKNFMSINRTIVIDPTPEGQDFSYFKVLTADKTVMAVAKIPEIFKHQVILVDFHRFFNVMSSFDDPEVDFGEHAVIISEGSQSVRINYGLMKSAVVKDSYTDRNALPMNDVLVRAVLTEAQIGMITKISDQLGNRHIIFSDSDPSQHKSKLVLTTVSPEMGDNVSDVFSLELDNYDTKVHNFRMVLNRDLLRAVPGSYLFEISKNKVAMTLDDPDQYLVYYMVLTSGAGNKYTMNNDDNNNSEE